MECGACGHRHVLTGQVKVDGIPLPDAAIEVVVELLCRHGKLGLPPAPDELVEPD
jgi:hypothetical protein